MAILAAELHVVASFLLELLAFVLWPSVVEFHKIPKRHVPTCLSVALALTAGLIGGLWA